MQLVFSLTAGRTGTRSLAGLLAANLPGAHVHHEQLISGPRGVHTPAVPTLLEFNNAGNTSAVRAFWERKFADILARPCHTWVETSHVLMKAGLIENIDLAADHDVHLVALRRDRRSLLRSYLRLGDFSRLGNRQSWYLDECGTKNLVPVPTGWGTDACGLALWYILEIEARVALYRGQLVRRAGVFMHDANVRDLSGGPPVDSLLGALQAQNSGPPVAAPPHNQGPAVGLNAAVERRIVSLLSEAQGFDAAAHLTNLLRRRRRPFRAVSRLGVLGGPDPSTAPAGVFIGGAGRSGTTALVDLLGCHSRLSPIFEMDFLPSLLAAFGSRPKSPAALAAAAEAAVQSWAADLPDRSHNKWGHQNDVHGAHHVLVEPAWVLDRTAALVAALSDGRDRWGALRDFTRDVCAAHARADNKPRWVNKTPSIVNCLAWLLGAFPRAKVLIVVRDPRDVALSVVKRTGGPDTIAAVPAWWKACMMPALLLAPAHPDRVRFVRYEDLVCNTAQTLADVLEFIGEDSSSETMLSQWRAAGLSMDPSRIGRWREQFSAADRAAFYGSLEGELDRFGYGPTR